MSDDARTDAELMQALAAGRMAALEALVRRHQDRVLSLAYRMVGRWDVAEDIAQETFLSVYGAAARYRPDARFSTWLYRIVANKCLDARRRSRRRDGHSEDADTVDMPDRAAADPLRESQRSELAERVRQAIGTLPQRQRTAITFHRYGGMSHQEIAQVTGWSESAVESLLVRAYASLRQALGDIEPS